MTTRRSALYSAISTTAAILILAAGCADQSPTAVRLDPVTVSAVAPGGPTLVQASQRYAAGTHFALIGPAGGSLDFGIGSISFPAGALERPTRISAAVDGINVAVEFGPHGLVFPSTSKPTLTFRSPADEGAFIAYLGPQADILEVLDTKIDTAAHTVSGQLGHFSRYGLATP